MIDSHCHLTDERLAGQIEQVLSRASSAGVRAMITIGTNLADAQAAIALCRARQNLRCAIGIHPNAAHEAQERDVDRLRELQADPAVVALGEMGLDYHWETARDAQRRIFRQQLALATDLGRPVVIHCREATDDTLAILADFASIRAVFHCFTGSMAEARRILDAGYFLGFTGPITYRKNDALREVVRATPIDRLLVETDAPYLSPEPMRKQKTNEPAFVIHTAAMVATIKGLTLQQVDEATTANVTRLFGFGISA